MKKLFKTFLYNFFVLFFIYLFLFSTKEVYANTYKIENIEISDEYNANFNKEDVIDKAFQAAFKILINKITISKDFNLLADFKLQLGKNFKSKQVIDYLLSLEFKSLANRSLVLEKKYKVSFRW